LSYIFIIKEAIKFKVLTPVGNIACTGETRYKLGK